MYLKNIGIKNIGPIDQLSIELPFNDNNNPKPVIFVGENGKGKTILQSIISDALYEIGGELFSDIRKSEGLGYKYFRVSGGNNIKIGNASGFSILRFHNKKDNNIEYFDKSGEIKLENFKDFIPDFTATPDDNKTNNKKVVGLNNTIKEELKNEWNNGVYFSQPAYRYEEPFWKTETFHHNSNIEEKNKFNNEFGKDIEIISSVGKNKSFLLDLVLDQYLAIKLSNEKEISNDPNNITNKFNAKEFMTLWIGSSSAPLLNSINNAIQKILKNDKCRLEIGSRGGYRVSIEEILDDKTTNLLFPSIDNLSLGESILLNFFVNIIRSNGNLTAQPDTIEGIVIIDEIDVHLHSDLQNSVLPELILMFPKVQFIITTHSPLFILGMKDKFGDNGFELRNMPSGELINPERFSEFERAYSILKETEKFEKEISENIKKSVKPILFVEGDYDIRYIKKSAELLGKNDILKKIEIHDANGYGGLDKIWKNYDSKLSEITPQNILLLYDCDTKKSSKQEGRIKKQIIPSINNHIILSGIENLFDKPILEKAISYKKSFIDITPEVKKIKRGEEITEPEKWEINKDEKGNLCNWICENGTKNDFVNFNNIFQIIEQDLLVAEQIPNVSDALN